MLKYAFKFRSSKVHEKKEPTYVVFPLGFCSTNNRAKINHFSSKFHQGAQF